MNTTPFRVRFAPSPTGYPHVGNFRTALYNFLLARHYGGQFLLRIEDTDKERSRPEYEEAIYESLRWMGLDWDEEPVHQSRNLARHQEEARRLIDTGHAYRCRCPAERIDALRERQMAAGLKPMYDGMCRDKNYPDDGTPFCVRLKTPGTGFTRISDRIRGEITVSNEEVDDLVLLRTDGTPTFNFAVVVDDHDMRITHVIRGDDHLNNTIKQVLIYEALGYPLPQFVHLPQILGNDKTRLSKRHGATGVLEYRDQGYLADAMVNYIARLGWGHGDQEFFTREELIRLFSIEEINKSAAVFDPQKLLWLNGEHIRAKSVEELADLFAEHMRRKQYLGEQTEAFLRDRGRIQQIVACTQVRAKTLDEIYQMVLFLFQEDLTYPEKEAQKFFRPDALQGLRALAAFAAAHRDQDLPPEAWEQVFQRVLNEQGLKMKALAQAVRLALTGTVVSPPIFDIIGLLGTNRVEARLRAAVEYAEKHAGI
ncbi:MAG TPA: glutamate--tRNA ligase [bacterium]|nr:glutamate--tRNA ligase [bacterium]